MKIALSLTKKPQNEIFITSLFDVNKKCKIPQGDLPPPSPPRSESHTPSRDEIHMGSSNPGSRFFHQMARKRRTS